MIKLSLQTNTLQIRCALTKGVHWFISILSCILFLFQVGFLFVEKPSLKLFLPLGMLLFLHVLSIIGLRLTSDRLVKELFKDIQTP